MEQQRTDILSSIPPVTKNLIILNLLFWVATLVFHKYNIDLVDYLGLHFPGAKDFMPHQFITYMFMHDPSSFAHIFCNMFALWMFGRVIESVWGTKRFLIFYFVTGIGAAIVQEVVWFFSLRDVLFASQDLINVSGTILTKSQFLNYYVTIGASGSIFGVLLAFAMLFPNIPLYIMFIPIPIKAKWLVLFYGVCELFLGVSSFGGDTVAHFAHLGGMLFGYFLIVYWKKKDKKKYGYHF